MREKSVETLLRTVKKRADVFTNWFCNFSKTKTSKGHELKSDKMAVEFGIHKYKSWVGETCTCICFSSGSILWNVH